MIVYKLREKGLVDKNALYSSNERTEEKSIHNQRSNRLIQLNKLIHP